MSISYNKQEVIDTGISLGSALAIVISWSINHSIFWALIHGLFSWFYVVYFYITQ